MFLDKVSKLTDDIDDENRLQAYGMLQDQLRCILEKLLPFEQEVIRMRFGLDDGYSYTIEDICKNLDTTRDAIRQIEAKVLKILKALPNDANF